MIVVDTVVQLFGIWAISVVIGIGLVMGVAAALYVLVRWCGGDET